MKHFLKNNNKGFSMVEVLVAIFILNLAVISTFILIQQILISASTSQMRLSAYYLAQEGVEIIRNIRDTNWLQGNYGKEGLISCAGNGCEADYKTGTPQQQTPLRSYSGAFLNVDANGFYSYSSGEASRFKRKIIINEGVEGIYDYMQVTVIVEWFEKDKSYNVEIMNKLYEWYLN